jgi:hypothetical protein
MLAKELSAFALASVSNRSHGWVHAHILAAIANRHTRELITLIRTMYRLSS